MSGLLRAPWVWSFVATGIVFLVTALFTGGASAAGLAQAALTFAAFSVIVGIGQMFVITLGPGNIDLSIPASRTLAGSFLSFLRIPPDWQIGAQGAILIIVLALRVLIDRTGPRA